MSTSQSLLAGAALLAAPYLVACGPAPRMLVTGSLSSSAPLEVTARPGAFTGDQLAFAPYRGAAWREQWTAADTQLFAERFSDFGGEYAYAFTLERDGVPLRQVGCRGNAVLAQADARRSQYAYVVRCSLWTADRAQERAFAEVDLVSGGEFSLTATDDAGEPIVFGVQPVLMSAGGAARQDPYGYQMLGADGPFAAVQADGPRVWLDPSTDEELQHDAAGLSAALVEAYHWSVAHLRTAR